MLAKSFEATIQCGDNISADVCVTADHHQHPHVRLLVYRSEATVISDRWSRHVVLSLMSDPDAIWKYSGRPTKKYKTVEGAAAMLSEKIESFKSRVRGARVNEQRNELVASALFEALKTSLTATDH